jgi:Holliday junction DNA helicase RuvA
MVGDEGALNYMISFLRGKTINKGKNFAVVLVNNIGYKVFVSQLFLADLAIGEEKDFYIYEQVGEQILALYGMRKMEELDFFELVLTVSGVGPKTALGVMDAASVEDIKDSILSGNPDLLNKVSGIGKKTAERVILELRTKVGKLDSESSLGKTWESKSEEIDALMALGYSLGQARDALKEVDTNIKDSGERIKLALRRMGK